jgi:2-polyprenyl-6-methoxyphenol hydroxylase-like FAD-dependent oxidoreductase
MSNDPDVLVIGGGPGGSALALHMRRLGRSVAIADKVRHPRFHVGESLLPGSLPLLAELGVLPDVEAAGFSATGRA